MLHFSKSQPPSRVLMKPRRSDSLRAGSGSGSGRGQDVLAGLAEELHDSKRVRDFGQEEDLKEALGKMIERVEELSTLLSQAYKTQSELETQAKLAKSNLQMALANNEMLEDALRRESAAGSKNVGWRRRNDSQTDQPPPTSDESSQATTSASRRGSASNSVQSAPASEAGHHPASVPNSPVIKPITSPQSPPAQETTQNSRFFRFRFGTSASTSTSPNPNNTNTGVSAGPSSRPQTPPPPASAGPAPAARRPLDAIRERDAAHLTSASLPSLVADTNKREHELEAALEAERARCEKVATEKRTLEAEVEGLSQALFEEANKMVAQERIKCAEIEEELRQVRQEKEALKSAMQIIEQENTKLRSPMPPQAETLEASSSSVPSAAEEGEPTPRTSRPSTPRTGSSKKTSSSSRSSISEQQRIDDLKDTKRKSSFSSTWAIHERSSTPGSDVRSLSPPPPEQLPAIDTDETGDKHQQQESTSTPTSDTGAEDEIVGEEQDLDAESVRSGESSSSATKSSFETMPASESPWAKI